MSEMRTYRLRHYVSADVKSTSVTLQPCCQPVETVSSAALVDLCRERFLTWQSACSEKRTGLLTLHRMRFVQHRRPACTRTCTGRAEIAKKAVNF